MNPPITLPSNPGELDLAFAIDGRLELTRTQAGFIPTNLLRTARNDLLIYGHLRKAADHFHYACVRVKPNGNIDESFGEKGFATGDFGSNEGAPGGNSFPDDIIELPDGKILLSGNYYPVGGGRGIYGVVRLNDDGSIDTSFGTDGKVLINPSPSATQSTDQYPPPQPHPEQVSNTTGNRHMCVLPDGRIVRLIQFRFDEYADFSLACLTPDGKLDTRFGDAGYADIVVPRHWPAYSDMVAAEDGKIAICGSVTETEDFFQAGLVLKFTGDGRWDQSFGNKGVLLLQEDDRRLGYTLRGMSVQPNKRLLLCGARQIDNANLLISIEPDGSPNIQFNRGEPLVAKVDGTDGTWSRVVVVQPEAKIILAGKVGEDFSLTRLLGNSTPDNQFAQGKSTLRYPHKEFSAASASVLHGHRLYMLSGFELIGGLVSSSVPNVRSDEK